MYKTIQMLEQLGRNSSIKQYETAQEMLANENISEKEINKLIDSNIPLICAWVPQNDEPEEKDDNSDKDKKEENKDKKN